MGQNVNAIKNTEKHNRLTFKQLQKHENLAIFGGATTARRFYRLYFEV